MRTAVFTVNEYYSWVTSHFSQHNFVVVAKIQGVLNLERFQNAVEVASKSQPMLAYSIDPDVCGFVPCNYHTKIEVVDTGATWQAVAESELSRSFSSREMLVRFSILQKKTEIYLVICLHHIIGDGISGVHFLKQILAFYAEPNFITQFSIQKRNLPINQLTAVHISPIKIIGKTKIRTIHLSKKTMNKIRLLVKKKRISLNAYMSFLVLDVASNIFNRQSFNVAIPVNLREKAEDYFLHPLKFYTSWIEFLWKKSFIDFCPEKKIYFEIRDQLKNKNPWKNLNDLLYSEENNDDDIVLGIKNNEISASKICISNLGLLDNIVSRNSDLKLTELHLSVSCEHYHKTQASFTAVLTELVEYGLFINLNYCDGFVFDHDMDLYVDAFQKLIESL